MHQLTKILVGSALIATAMSGQAHATCTSYPYTLTNGSTADASQVMANFNCAALTSGATINGATLTGTTAFPGSGSMSAGGSIGIGMTPVNILDITQNVNGSSWVGINNPSTGVSASSGVLLSGPTGTHAAFFLYGSGVTGGPGAKAAVLQGSDTNLYLTSSGASAPVIFGINYSEAGRFGTDGSFLVGTTTNGGWTGSSYVEYKGTTSKYALSLWQSGAATSASIIRVDATTDMLVDWRYSTTQVGSVTTNSTSTSYNTTSDERLKDVLPNQTNYRAAIENIWVGDFSWKKSKEHDFGIRAQQAYQLFPYAIEKPVNPDKEWQADYGKLSPLALWGVKDLYKLVGRQEDNADKQSAAVEDLKGKVASQTAEIELLDQKLASVEKRLNETLARN